MPHGPMNYCIRKRHMHLFCHIEIHIICWWYKYIFYTHQFWALLIIINCELSLVTRFKRNTPLNTIWYSVSRITLIICHASLIIVRDMVIWLFHAANPYTFPVKYFVQCYLWKHSINKDNVIPFPVISDSYEACKA